MTAMEDALRLESVSKTFGDQVKVDIVRDLGMLLMAAQLWWAGKGEEDDVTPPP